MSFVQRLLRALGRVVTGIVKGVVLLILLGAVSVLSAWITIRFVIVGQEVVVPQVVGLSLNEATELARSQGLYLAVRTELHSDEVRENEIMEQDPSPGLRLKVNKRIYVIVSRGSREIMVPNLVGLTLAQAQIRLNEDGIELGRVMFSKSNNVVEGTVAAHEPPPGTEYVDSSPMTLLVSSGPEEIAFVMPDLIGRHVDDVVRFLQDAGLRLGDITEEDYEGLVAGTITGQTPRPGSRVAATDIITLNVVRGAFPGLEDGSGYGVEGYSGTTELPL